MARLTHLTIEGFRSIKEQISLNFPQKQPVILIGENNAGKSNIIRAIELMFGEFHPKYKRLEDFDHYGRDCNDIRSGDDSSGNHRKDALKAIGIPEGELEGILNMADWNISDKFCVFGADFEKTMRNSFCDYCTIEDQKKIELGSSSKHLIAREVAKNINIIEDSTGKQYFKQLIEKIKNLGVE